LLTAVPFIINGIDRHARKMYVCILDRQGITKVPQKTINIFPIVAKIGGLQSQGGKCEAVLILLRAPANSGF
jgi:hypothetical protein